MVIRSAILLSLLVLIGCATPLSDEARRVQVHSQMSNLLGDCKKIGPVTTAPNATIVAYEQLNAAKNELREITAKKGGDTVVIVNIDEDGFRKIVTIQGIAMKCF